MEVKKITCPRILEEKIWVFLDNISICETSEKGSILSLHVRSWVVR